MQAMAEAMRAQISSLIASLDPNTSFKVLVHNSILDDCGLLQKREELTDDDACDEDPEFQEEIQQQKREEQDEALRLFSESMAYKERLKNIALIIGSTGGWFMEAD